MLQATNGEIVACPGCDLLQRIPPLGRRSKARCPRCEEPLASPPPAPGRALALTATAAIAFVVAHTSPLIEMTAVGRRASTTIIGAAQQLWADGYEVTAVFVGFFSFVAPALYIAFMLTILAALVRPPAPRSVGSLLRFAEALRPWSMSEVMLVGILVSFTKIAQLVSIAPGVGMYAVFVLMIVLALIPSSFEARRAWDDIEWVERDARRELGEVGS